MRISPKTIPTMLLLSLLLAACGGGNQSVPTSVPVLQLPSPQPTPLPTLFPTTAPVTEAGNGEPSADESAAETAATGPAAEPATAVPIPPATDCIDGATFVSDITIPDNSQLQVNASFVKTWRLLNSGTCTWTTGYSLVHVGGELLNAPASSLPLDGSVSPGSTADISLPMQAPAEPGTYQSDWQLSNARGELFGVGQESNPFWARIVVLSQEAAGNSSISGFAWDDRNENGRVDNRELLENATIMLASAPDCRTIFKRTHTDEDGRFTISGVAAGSYCLIGANGSQPVTQVSIQVGNNQALANIYLVWPDED